MFQKEEQDALCRLSQLLDKLRSDCPWDRAQTLGSLRYLTVEEVHELSEAIAAVEETGGDEKSASELKKELGDLLMHVMFYSKIAQDAGYFSLADVADAITEKLIKRHPHIFGNEQQVPWEQVKMREGRKSVLEGVPASLPSMVKSVRMQEKARGIGYQEDATPVAPVPPEALADEQRFGDYLMQVVSAGLDAGLNADDALTFANRRFKVRVEEWESKKRH